MNVAKIFKYSITHALGATLYISVVVTFMNNAKEILGPVDSVLSGMLMLLLLVISAGTMGLLVFGRPIIWYLDGAKREAIYLAVGTLCSLAILAIIILSILLINF